MSGDNTIRARFAPSPTGYLHVGGARTALFNWLFCRQHGGRFILRIEDTDILRNIEGAEQKLIDDLRWLGIDYDEGPDIGGPLGPYRQSERRDLYDAAAKKLLASGDAYYAFDTAEELEAMRREATALKQSFKYPRPKVLPTEADAARARSEGRPVVIRFKTPLEPITVHDEILGDVTFAAGEIEDLVIVKSNGWPTYHFAVVVDDAAMQITHVLRAQEHLMNTPKHVFMQRALGYAPPRYAHLPLVFNIDGTKMSKRDKHKVVRTATKNLIKQGKWTADDVARIAECKAAAATAWLDKAETELDMTQVGRLATAAGVEIPEIDVHDFRASGYLPEALANFVALIGWSPGGDREMLTREEMTAEFSLDRINKTAGRFDREKLLAMNTVYCAEAAPERLLAGFRDYAQAGGSPLASLDDKTLADVLRVCKGFRTFHDIDLKVGILFAPDESVQYDPKAVKDVLEKKEGAGYAMLERLLPPLESLEPWTAERIDALVKEICEQTGAKTNDVAQPLRVALTGRTISPAIGETLALLSKERTLRRIRRCLETRNPSQ
ncbi:MAG TPA: glutamate--tRNA ligase [Phycisphaerae bacterium]|nr:glutamate--tRNA ligase [Phycisphaerae bacterium]